MLRAGLCFLPHMRQNVFAGFKCDLAVNEINEQVKLVYRIKHIV